MEPEMPENPLKTGMLRQKTAISTHGRVAHTAVRPVAGTAKPLKAERDARPPGTRCYTGRPLNGLNANPVDPS
jgi:hypothetical protein